MKLVVLLPTAVNARVSFLKSLAQRELGAVGGMFVIRVRDDTRGLLTCQLADGMRAHAVRNEKNVSFVLPLLRIDREKHGVRILIMTAPDTDVGHTGKFDLIVANHQRSPQKPPVDAGIMLKRGTLAAHAIFFGSLSRRTLFHRHSALDGSVRVYYIERPFPP
jgi:hypothetical protein